MRWWALLLAMYVVVLSAVPCHDACQDEPILTTTQGSAPTPDDHTPHKACVPFGQCATCTGFTVPCLPQLVVGAALPPLATVVRPAYQTPATLEVRGRIWQPPQVA